jgi:RNA polymerase sigma factor (sigma-70 family)
VGDIPAEAPGFRPRAGLLAELDRAPARVSVIHAVAGRHGAGSTQVAAAYARAKLQAGWRLVAWVNGAETGSLLAGLAAVADATGLTDDESGRGITDAAATVRQWLETDGDRCLLVFDDVSDPAALAAFVPADGLARVLITTTRESGANLGSVVPVDVFSAAEASAFLAGRTGLDDEAGAAEVAAVLGHLPLALALAAPVIRGQRHGYARYLDRLQTIPIEASLTGDDGQRYPHGVVRAVLLSLAAVRESDRTGMCTRIMQIMAVLSAAGVRRELLYVAGRAGVLASGGRRVEAALVDRALEWLSDRSLLTFSLDGQTVAMHRPVAHVVRYGLSRRERLGAVCWVAASVLEAHAIAVAGSQDHPGVRGIPQQVTALLDNTAELAGEIDEELAETLLRLRFIALYHLIELGDSTPQAIAVGEPLTADLERLLGPGHPDTLNARNSLAAAYLAADRVAEAIPLFEQTLAVLQGQLGSDHLDTLTSQNNLASAYQDAGRVAEAIQLYELNLAARERLLGPDHPGTLTSQGNLAAAYLAAGRVAEAIPLLERTLASRERLLGSDHPDTQTSRKNLAKAYQDAGRAAEAVPLLERTSAGRLRVPRSDHPRTQISRKNLAPAHQGEDGVAKPIPPPEQTLAARERQAPADAAAAGPSAGFRESQAPPDAAAGPSASFRRPPAEAARPVLPGGFRRPPADPAGRLPADRAAGSPVKLPDRSSPSRTQDAPPEDAKYEREVIAAIAAGDPAGIALAYDRYAAGLYGYCHWMLHDSADAAESLQDTFILAAALLTELPEPAKLRAWLFALARNECRHRIRPRSATHDEADAARQPADGGQRADEVGHPAAPAMQIPVADESADVTIRLPRPDESADVTIRLPRPDQSADATVRLPRPGDLADATMQFPVVGEAADATMQFRAVSGPGRAAREPADAIRGLADATMQFRAIGGLADATMQFRAIGGLADATMQFRVISQPAGATNGLADFDDGYLGQAELRALIRSVLADMKPREREVVELSFRHDLHDDDLAIALGLSSSRAHALASRTRGRLEKSLGTLRTALAGRQACPVVGELLADWDGQLSEQTRDLVAWHIEQCQTCINQAQGALRPTVLSGLLPLAPLPPELRKRVVFRCASTSEEAVAYRRRVVRRAESTWAPMFSQAIRRLSWGSIRANPGAAIVATAAAAWIVAAVIVTLLTFAGAHAAQAAQPTGSRATHAQVGRTSAGISPAAARATVTAPASVAAKPSPRVTQSSTYVSSQVEPSPSPEVSRSPSPRPSKSPKPSKSPSPSRSPSASPSKSPSPSPSASSSSTA